MPVEINVRGVEGSFEYEAAVTLAGCFRNSFQGAVVGKIDICPNLKVPGQKRKDVDLLVVGLLQNATLPVEIESEEGPREVSMNISSFAFVIEVKDHTVSDAKFLGNRLLVRYNGRLHDATEQSSEEMYSIRNYSVVRLGESPQLCHFVWMRNLPVEQLRDLAGGRLIRDANVLPKEFPLSHLWRIACAQNVNAYLCSQGGTWWFNAFTKASKESGIPARLVELVAGTLDVPGELSRKRVEVIASRMLERDSDLKAAFGKKLVVFAGRAGTGKTIRMLRAACELAGQGKRSLFLSFNRALVQDLRRLLYHANVPDIPEGGVRLLTLYEFVKDVATTLGLLSTGEDLLHRQKYIGKCQEIADCIRTGALTEQELEEMAARSPDLLTWDHVFIDEAQDCEEAEKALLFALFQYRQLAIADGIDQFTRGIRSCDWEKNIYVARREEKVSLRQKRNLAVFCNEFATALALRWYVQPQEQMTGGKVYLNRGLYPFDLFAQVRAAAAGKNCSPYDMLFLSPPSLVVSSTAGFSAFAEFGHNGFKLWDGSRGDIRVGKPADISDHRLLQYNSCRGLEGWSVVCLAFDEYIRHTRKHAPLRNEQDDDALELLSEEERLQRLVGLNALIPLTRAIDTLVITINDWDSDEARWLCELAGKMPDFVEVRS